MSYKLIHGDCLEVMPTLADKSIDAVITDPPYGLNELWTGGGWFQRGVYNGAVEWDSHAPQKAIDAIIQLKIQPTIIWGGNYFVLPTSRCWDIWSKTNNVRTMSDFEMCWTNNEKPSKMFEHPCNGWKRSHPTEKPLDLIVWQIERHTKKGDTILDPFMGSGTTGVACMRTGRNFIGIEINAEYFAIAQRRIEEATYQPSLFAPQPSQWEPVTMFGDD